MKPYAGERNHPTTMHPRIKTGIATLDYVLQGVYPNIDYMFVEGNPGAGRQHWPSNFSLKAHGRASGGYTSRSLKRLTNCRKWPPLTTGLSMA
jgi:hypothetical protein